MLLVSESGGGGSIWGVFLSLAFSRSGVLSIVSSFTMLSSSDDDSVLRKDTVRYVAGLHPSTDPGCTSVRSRVEPIPGYTFKILVE